METLEQIQTKVDKIVTGKQKKVAKVRKKLDSTLVTITRAEKQLAQAKDTIDADTYVKAKLTLEKAKTEKQLYSDILEDLERKPLLPYDEYKKIVDSIYLAADNAHDDLCEQAEDVLPQLKELHDKAGNVNKATFDLLRTLKSEVANDGYKKDSDGYTVVDGWELKYSYGIVNHGSWRPYTMYGRYEKVADMLKSPKRVKK